MNWDEAKLEILNMTEVEATMESVCVPPRPGHVVMPMKRNFTSHRSVCRKLKGVASVVKDAETQEVMNEEMKKYPACGNSNGRCCCLTFAHHFVGYTITTYQVFFF